VSVTPEEALARPSSPRQYTQDGKRYPARVQLNWLAWAPGEASLPGRACGEWCVAAALRAR
jgi:hypothetical protein